MNLNYSEYGDAIVKANIAASQTDSSLVSAKTGFIIAVYQLAVLVGGTATDVTFNSKPSGAGVAISPLFAFGANGGIVLPFTGRAWFKTVVSEGLTVTTGAGSTSGILLSYKIITQ
jgi:hypothetical protein